MVTRGGHFARTDKTHSMAPDPKNSVLGFRAQHPQRKGRYVRENYQTMYIDGRLGRTYFVPAPRLWIKAQAVDEARAPIFFRDGRLRSQQSLLFRTVLLG